MTSWLRRRREVSSGNLARIFGVSWKHTWLQGHSGASLCFTTGIATPVPLLAHVTSRRFGSGWLASGSTSAPARLGQLTLLTTSGQWPKSRPSSRPSSFNEGPKRRNQEAEDLLTNLQKLSLGASVKSVTRSRTLVQLTFKDDCHISIPTKLLLHAKKL